MFGLKSDVIVELGLAFRLFLEMGIPLAAPAAVFVAVAAQAPAALTLGAIEITGTKRYTSDELLRLF
jgi:hypothetical protein